jgi:hypothetical protein
MRTAREANTLSKQVQLDRCAAELKAIEAKIENATKGGAFAIRIENGLSITARKQLADNGYKIEHYDDQRGGDNYHIVSWAHL